MARKRRKKISKGAFAAVLLAAVPAVLFAYWIYLGAKVSRVKTGPQVVVYDIPDYYKLCQTGDPLAEIDRIEEGFVPEQIVIESVGINLPVVSVSLEGGTWEVIDGVANYAQETSLVNPKDGNVGIYGHDRDYVFLPVKELKKGDEIFVFAKDYKVVYLVEDSMTLKPEEVDVFYFSETPVLTLVTCDGVFSQRRFIIRAKFDRIVQLNCN